MNVQGQNSVYPEISPETLTRFWETVPPPPSIVRYFDVFKGVRHTIHDLASRSSADIDTEGRLTSIKFGDFGDLDMAMKVVFADMLARLDPTTVAMYFTQLRPYCAKRGLEALRTLAVSQPHFAKAFWQSSIGPIETSAMTAALRSVLHSLCRLSVGYWRPSLRQYVKGFGGIQPDKLKTVREGNCFVPSDDLANIFEALDDLTARIQSSPRDVGLEELRDGALTMISVTRALRPGQLALVETEDVIVYPESVHLAVRHIKERAGAMRTTTQIRLRHEWCPIIVAYLERRGTMTIAPDIPARLLFSMTSHQISNRISAFAEAACGKRWCPTDFRHTAAQRNADSGMSRLELQRFLFHKSDYANMRRIANTKVIKRGELSKLPPDRQIGGIPGGIPIAGIGACDAGQSLCSLHPVLSCYSCPKFLPVSDVAIHLEVLEAFRTIVREFVDTAVGDERHPAYAQLAPVLTRVRAIIGELKASEDEEDERGI